MQAALEAEVTEFLGRDRYQRSTTAADARSGSRNGYRPSDGQHHRRPSHLGAAKLRGTTAAFASRLFGKHVTKTNALESLVIAAFVRGLSVRDVQATLARRAGGSGRDLEIDCLAGMSSDQNRQHQGAATPGRCGARLPVPGCLLLPDASRLDWPSRSWPPGGITTAGNVRWFCCLGRNHQQNAWKTHRRWHGGLFEKSELPQVPVPQLSARKSGPWVTNNCPTEPWSGSLCSPGDHTHVTTTDSQGNQQMLRGARHA